MFEGRTLCIEIQEKKDIYMHSPFSYGERLSVDVLFYIDLSDL